MTWISQNSLQWLVMKTQNLCEEHFVGLSVPELEKLLLVF
jgi:hypothetical protein